MKESFSVIQRKRITRRKFYVAVMVFLLLSLSLSLLLMSLLFSSLSLLTPLSLDVIARFIRIESDKAIDFLDGSRIHGNAKMNGLGGNTKQSIATRTKHRHHHRHRHRRHPFRRHRQLRLGVIADFEQRESGTLTEPKRRCIHKRVDQSYRNIFRQPKKKKGKIMEKREG